MEILEASVDPSGLRIPASHRSGITSTLPKISISCNLPSPSNGLHMELRVLVFYGQDKGVTHMNQFADDNWRWFDSAAAPLCSLM